MRTTRRNPLFSACGWRIPKYLSNSRFHDVDVKEIKTVPYVPLSHPFVERLIGTIRRKCLDHTLFWTAADLEMKLADFQRYYNGHRAHVALDGSAPESIPDSGGARASLHAHRWRAHCRGLYQTPMAA
jgi:putative transposase